MCLAVPGKIVAIDKRKVTVEYPGVGAREAMVGVEGVGVGDWVRIQMGVVMERIGQEEARELEADWTERTKLQ